MILDYRNDFNELSKSEQSFVILGHIAAHRQHVELQSVYDGVGRKKYGKRSSDKKRVLITYMFRGVNICLKLYLFLHNLGLGRFKALIAHFDEKGLCDRVHGLCNKLSVRTNVITQEKTVEVIVFIKNYADKVGVPLPGRLPSHKDIKMTKLPSADTKASIFRRYCEASSNPIARSSFYQIWKDHCPYITPMKPSDDLCDVCRENTIFFGKSTEGAAHLEARMVDFLEHINHAKMQRTYYQEKSAAASESNLVLCFDFAQNVGYPSSPQQPGSAYFKSLRKCGIFGIFNAGTKEQHNYLIDEAQDVGKGPNCVISMLDHYLSKHSSEEDVVTLFADNCVSQNKNNVMLHYLSDRVQRGLNKRIELDFLLTGHTKFAPDRMFGILKVRFSKSNVDDYEDLVKCVVSSTPSGKNLVVRASEVVFKKYDKFFPKFNCRLKGKHFHNNTKKNSVR